MAAEGGEKKAWALALMPCLGAMAAAVAGVAGGAKADPSVMEAAWKDALATLERVMSAQCGALRTEETVRERPVQVLTTGGWAKVSYPYAPGQVTARSAVALLCGKEQGKKRRPKATEAARKRIAKGAALLPYALSRDFLSAECGLDAGRETHRRIAMDAGKRTRAAIAKGRPAATPRLRAWSPPPGALRVPKTKVVLVDGKAFPCVKKDLRGRRGRNGAAKKRNANRVVVGTFEWVDRKGNPLFAPGAVRHYPTGAGGSSLADEVWLVAQQEDVSADGVRVQFLTDGEEELEGVCQTLFAGMPNVTRTLDAMHACGYADALCKALEKDAAAAEKTSRKLRRTLVREGWKGFQAAFQRRFGRHTPDTLEGDAAQAWKYLSKRRGQMDYAECRRRHLPIGSGMVEASCKNTIGERLEGTGMRWRFDNGIRLATLRAQLKSGLEITV